MLSVGNTMFCYTEYCYTETIFIRTNRQDKASNESTIIFIPNLERRFLRV